MLMTLQIIEAIFTVVIGGLTSFIFFKIGVGLWAYGDVKPSAIFSFSLSACGAAAAILHLSRIF